ncbi:enoyl-CoA hydratase-related protein [Streptomyces sp. NBC_00988]|uniref:enoyl-CoA hydratase/isomerase family protein n=1 Tax=Streptomyces sp. NBC_00988 TaxID=2903704 RepID=UPI00386F3487|nr:enoyl-CoA hydratase-related protein [Streptomyces sp. NBC_00988]
MSAEKPLLVERHSEGVVVLTLSVPDRRNAMTTELTAAWRDTIAGLRGDDEVRCVIVTGSGSAFCAGGDLDWLGDARDEPVDFFRARMSAFYRDWLSIRKLEVPTVAALNGAAVGAGLSLALACDLRYATPTAAMSVPFTALGLHPGMATTWLLPEVTSVAVARDLLLTGRVVRGPEALALGLVSGLAEDVLGRALSVGSAIAGKAPLATRLTKAALARGGHRSIADALEWEALAQPVTMATEDLHEGLAAQRQRRRPDFTGR